MAQNVIVYCKNTQTYKDYPLGTSLIEVMRDMELGGEHPYLAALVNNKLESLTYCVYKSKNVEFVNGMSSFGRRVYVHSLIMVLHKAVEDVLPGARIRVEHPISNGYFCHILFPDLHYITLQEIALLKSRMSEIIATNLPISREEKETTQVVELFKKRKQDDVANLLESLAEPFSTYYRIGNTIDYCDNVLLPSTGYLSIFDILPYYDGVLLQVPDKEDPKVLSEIIPQPKIMDIFKEFDDWSDISNIKNISDINSICKEKGKAGILIKVFEALHEKKASQIADQIKERGNVRLVLVAGPSSSGKTTFSKRLSIQLLVEGIIPFPISTDDYFVDRTHTPLDENGNPDFETIEAMDLKLFNQQLKDLMEGKEVLLSEYDFIQGKKIFKRKCQLPPNAVIVIEGIHALNPELTKEIDDAIKFKVYVSALTTITLDNHNWISTTDTRLLRRILRDSRSRGYSAQKTISQWPSVRKGEEKWIFPFQETADAVFNSALPFEFSALKNEVEPVLMEVPKNRDEYAEAYRLLRFLRYITPIANEEIPKTSLLREFIGGSSFNS
ncbi:MAG: nucleoside kinase [Paludibacteraceae bacterium]|nr:nucleoside kinase [Paludibacteraceae bacterium]